MNNTFLWSKANLDFTSHILFFGIFCLQTVLLNNNTIEVEGPASLTVHAITHCLSDGGIPSGKH